MITFNISNLEYLIVHRLKFIRSTILGCKDIEIRKSEFVAKAPLCILWSIESWNVLFANICYIEIFTLEADICEKRTKTKQKNNAKQTKRCKNCARTVQKRSKNEPIRSKYDTKTMQKRCKNDPKTMQKRSKNKCVVTTMFKSFFQFYFHDKRDIAKFIKRTL